MPNLEKATLLAVKRDSAAPLDGATPVPVQFNPSSLHFTLASASDSGKTPARPDEQHLGSGNVTVTLELHFDTADEGTTETPVSVRTKTADVARFMLPAPGSSDPPPRVRFSWGDFVLVGVMGSYTEDVDLFSPQGIPLRAKVSISIRGQDPGRAANKSGAGAKNGAGATKPGAVGGAPGTVGFGASLSVGASASLSVSAGLGIGAGASLGAGLSLGDRTGVAIGGESAAEFSARMGADPSAWRGVAAGLDSTISLPAGAEIDFSSSLSANVGLGASVGVASGASSSIEAAVGLGGESAVPARAGAAAGTSAGMALAAAGGVQEALATTQVASATSAASGAKQAYGLPAASPAATSAEALVPSAALQPRPPLRAGELPVAGARSVSPPAPAPRRADPRATSFGYGVPLRPAVTGAAESRAGALGGVVTLGAHERSAVDVPVTPDPTSAPWLALRAADAGRSAANEAQGRRRPLCRCGGGLGCGCGCGGGGGGCGCGGGCG
jgi:hypothetical protein